MYFYIPTCVERWSHFSLGEDSTPPTLGQNDGWEPNLVVIKGASIFWGTYFSHGFVVGHLQISMTFSRLVFLVSPSKRIRCPTHSPSLPFHIPPIHPSIHHIPPPKTPPHPSILLMVRKSCTTWNVQNLQNDRINYQPLVTLDV